MTTDGQQRDTTFEEGWAILELMGHRKLGGVVREATIGGATFIRIDVPGPNAPWATQFYSPASVYCITPTTEAMARAVAFRNQPEPVARWELPTETKLASGANLDVELENPF